MNQFKSVFLLAIAIATPSRVLAQTAYNQVPSRIVGQPALQQTGALTMIAPNLVEGKEFRVPEAIAVDTSSTPPILYVADTGNNRVLAWKDATAFSKGNKADLVIGQRDFYSVTPQGPANPQAGLSAGLAAPTALAVDASGSLYVADGGNNRILRFKAPFKQNGALLQQSLIIGQTDLTGHSANQGNSTPSATSLALLSGSSPFRIGMAFDSAGNLWVSDPGNNRVLRFPAGSLTDNNNAPAADVVLGQGDFMTGTLPSNPVVTGKNFLNQPSGLAFDPKGRLFVADTGNPGRVLVFLPPFGTGESASRIMGVIPPTQTNPNPPAIGAGTLGGAGGPPQGVFFIGSNPYVVDTGNARILKYDPYESWPAESTTFSPVATAVLGQVDFVSNQSNQHLKQPTASTLSGPIGAHAGTVEAFGAVAGVFAGTDLFVVDSGNNRVLAFPQSSSGSFALATRLLGQDDFQYNSINLIEGREFYLVGGATVIDWNSSPPHLYVSDPGNNRVLAFNDYRKVAPYSLADLIIGQPDGKTGMVNYPNNDPNLTSNMGLYAPQGLAIDPSGNLWIADTGNGRVLRFPSPFKQTPSGTAPVANLVIGQSSFFTKVTDASPGNMHSPYGVAFTVLGHLLVSDSYLNRVLFFIKPSGADFTDGQQASNVIGQPDYGPPSEPAGPRALVSPRLITVDQDDKLYVADEGNSRIVIYFQVPTLGVDPEPSLSITGLSQPFGVFTDKNTGEVWVADTGNNRVLRYPKFSDLSNTTPAANVTIPSNGPTSVSLDPFDNPVVTEGGVHRVAFFYQQIGSSGNAANYFTRFAPGMLASMFAAQGSHFGLVLAGATSVPLPTTLGDVQVLVGGRAAPLLYVSQSQINFQIPYETPVGSNAVEIRVVSASTGQIIASNFYRIDPYAPGLFTLDSSGEGQLAALNQDNTLNSATHPAKAGSIIQLFGTGVGLVSGAPADGMPAPNGLLPTSNQPLVYINGTQVPVKYSGLAPGFIGLWQVNAQIPANPPTPNIAVDVTILFQGINSKKDALGNTLSTTIRTTP